MFTFFFTQVLNNSGLVAWHSFDGGSHNDSSGNRLNAIQVVNVSSVAGRINEALSFYSNSSLYEIADFVQLGQTNSAYSVTLWVQPFTLSEAPLVHLSQTSIGQNWCIDMLGFLSNGQLVCRSWAGSPMIINGSVLPINTWTHVATTYSSTIGLQLYINGALINGTPAFSFSASGASMYLTLVNSLLGVQGGSCNTYMIAHTGTFKGLIDEFRVYARQLSADDIYALANP
ncbi:unnamed protein product [Rotaria magnacalcarata]|uniref:LamG domain-containing protein n=2 Tax=Rotaria magnacalcarata TaxID=392030 RepID=A0A816Q4G7_9BILA|nr:unnamed protein product [Rotaria magnacalcarata]